jgi:hypothetical protein
MNFLLGLRGFTSSFSCLELFTPDRHEALFRLFTPLVSFNGGSATTTVEAFLFFTMGTMGSGAVDSSRRQLKDTVSDHHAKAGSSKCDAWAG